MFEDLFRKSFGLPPQRQQPSSSSGSTVNRAEGADDSQTAPGVVEVAAAAATAQKALLEAADRGEDSLAMDPDVARLLAELQTEFDADCSDADGDDLEEGQENAADGDEHETAAGKENNQNVCDTGSDRTGNPANEHNGSLHDTSGEAPGSVSPSRGGVCERELADGTRNGVLERGGVAQENDSIAAGFLGSHAQQGRIDISRMKIDGSERGARTGPRPRSAPSACLSAGGFSRLSRSSSSHLARTASQKLLQATKEAEGRTSRDAQDGGGGSRRAPNSVILQLGGKMDVVKRNADALQVCQGASMAHFPGKSRWGLAVTVRFRR